MLIRERTFDADWLRDELRKIAAMFPPKKNQTAAREYGRDAYKWRSEIGILFAKIQELTDISRRFGKTAVKSQAKICLAYALITAR